MEYLCFVICLGAAGIRAVKSRQMEFKVPGRFLTCVSCPDMEGRNWLREAFDAVEKAFRPDSFFVFAVPLDEKERGSVQAHGLQFRMRVGQDFDVGEESNGLGYV